MLSLTFPFLNLLELEQPNIDNTVLKVKGKVFYGQESPSGDSTTTESGVNYQLLSVMH